ncbi:MAG: GNAT family N-acetyltransferase [Chitinophagaceae bacterium]
MEKLIIREATIKDMDVLLQFEQGVIEAERPFDNTLKTETWYYKLEEMITAPHIHLLVATIDDKLVASGYCRIENAKHFVQHQQHGFMGFMFTAPGHRGLGINSQIIEALKEWALSKNITEFRLEVYAENKPAIKAYQKVGFTPYMIEMRLSV